MRSWKLPTASKVIDKLRSSLLGEMASAEWEFLEKREWDDEAPESRVIVSKSSPDRTERNTVRSMRTRSDGQSNMGSDESNPNSRPKGMEAWMRVRNR